MSPLSVIFLDQLGDQIQVKHYCSRTSEAYIYWSIEFVLFHKVESGAFRHSGKMGINDIQKEANLYIQARNPSMYSIKSTSPLVILPAYLVVQTELTPKTARQACQAVRFFLVPPRGGNSNRDFPVFIHSAASGGN